MTDTEIRELLDSLVKFGEPVKVKLSVIDKQKGSAETKDHETRTIITGCQQTLGWPVSKTSGRYVDIFIDEAERKEFERKLGLKEGELNVFIEASQLKWPARFQNQVRITKEGVEFDLRSPMDYIKYRIAALSPKVAKNLKDLEYRKAECDYVFENKQAEAAAQNKTNRVKLRATAMLAEVLDDPKKKRDLYKVLTQTEVPKDFSQEMLENVLMKVVQDTPDKIISTLEDPDFQTKLVVFDAIKCGEIIIRGTGYYLSHNDKVVIATNRRALVDWFKNKENNAEIIRIKSVIEAKNK